MIPSGDDPEQRTPNLLECFEAGILTDDLLQKTKREAARIYARIIDIQNRHLTLTEDGSTSNPDVADAQREAHLEHLIRQGVGIYGSDKLLETGLTSFIDNPQVISDFGKIFRETAGVFLDLSADLQPDFSFDFTWLNFVLNGEGSQTFVDLDGEMNYDFALYTANAVSMSDVIARENITLDEDIVINGEVIMEKGVQITGKDFYYLELMNMIYEEAGPERLEGKDLSDPRQMLRYMPVAEFFRSFLLAGVFSMTAREQYSIGEVDEAKISKRHGINCFLRATGSLALASSADR